jgi:hypothetical protein
MALVAAGNATSASNLIQAPPANNKAACRFTNSSGGDFIADTLYFRWGVAQATPKVRAVVYSDSAGSPGTLLTSSAERVGVGTGWESFTLSPPVAIAAGAAVWLGVIADATLNCYLCTPGGAIRYNSDSYADGPAATFGAASTTAFTYPVFVTGDDGLARFGRATGSLGGSGNYQPDREHIDRFTLATAGSVVVQSISTYVQTTSASVKSKAAIFADASGSPGTLVAQTEEVTGSTSGAWLMLPFAAPPTLTPGTYWLAFVADTNLVTPTFPVGGSLKADTVGTEATQWTAGPHTYSAPLAPLGIAIYADYEAAPSVVPFAGGDVAAGGGAVIRFAY